MKRILILLAAAMLLTACGKHEKPEIKVITNTLPTPSAEPKPTEPEVIIKDGVNGIVSVIGSDELGYIEADGKWEYFDRRYYDADGAEIGMGTISNVDAGKDIEEFAEEKAESLRERYSDVVITAHEVGGVMAYKITYSRENAIEASNSDRKGYTSNWYFKTEDGKVHSVTFYSDTDKGIFERSDKIMATYYQK